MEQQKKRLQKAVEIWQSNGPVENGDNTIQTMKLDLKGTLSDGEPARDVGQPIESVEAPRMYTSIKWAETVKELEPKAIEKVKDKRTELLSLLVTDDYMLLSGVNSSEAEILEALKRTPQDLGNPNVIRNLWNRCLDVEAIELSCGDSYKTSAVKKDTFYQGCRVLNMHFPTVVGGSQFFNPQLGSRVSSESPLTEVLKDTLIWKLTRGSMKYAPTFYIKQIDDIIIVCAGFPERGQLKEGRWEAIRVPKNKQIDQENIQISLAALNASITIPLKQIESEGDPED